LEGSTAATEVPENAAGSGHYAEMVTAIPRKERGSTKT